MKTTTYSKSTERLLAECRRQREEIAGLRATLDWFCQFVGEHPEWEAEQFPPDSAEREWLDIARAALAEVRP